MKPADAHPSPTERHQHGEDTAAQQAVAIVARMTLDEKAEFLSGADVWRLPANDRLGLPSVVLTDGPHGVRKQASEADHPGLTGNLPATCFPTGSALASTWDVELLREIGQVLGAEAAAQDVGVLLGPAMNIKRHPLCGRNFEYLSEDPLLCGELAAAMIDGIQSQGVGACIKHFAANDQEHGRMVTDVVADERTLREIHLRGFEIAVNQAQPWTVMAAYNRVNGTYCSENAWLLEDVLRRDWNFRGAVVTDWGAANDRVQGLLAGNDLEMPTSGGLNNRRVLAAVRRGDLSEGVLDRAVARVVELILKIARRDRQGSPVNADAHDALARRAAAEGMVLLKNDNDLLPIAPDTRIAIIGAFAKTPRYQGTGSSRVTPTRLACAFDAIRAAIGGQPVVYAAGYDPEASEPDPALIAEASAAAARADVAVVFAGLPTVYESEGFDRAHMRLPEQHDRLIQTVCAANANTVVVLSNGAPVEMPWVEAPAAIIEAYLGGQAGGEAVADILLGRCNPCGKLAETFPLRQTDVASDQWFPGSARQVQYREGRYVGYRYFDRFRQPVLFPFGHGLGYTRFTYEDLRIAPRNGDQVAYRVTFTLHNVGDRDGAEVVQLYVHRLLDAPPDGPEQELRGFAKIRLEAGECRTVSLDLDADAFAHYDVGTGCWATAPGTYEIRVGASSRDLRLRDTVDVKAAANPPPVTVPPAFEDGRLVVDDETFAAMLGTPVPNPDGVRPFHLNSTVSEIASTWLGRRVANGVKGQFLRRMGGGDAATRKMIERMADDMPLRSLVMFFGGRVGLHVAEAFAAILNRRYVKALRLLTSRRR